MLKKNAYAIQYALALTHIFQVISVDHTAHNLTNIPQFKCYSAVMAKEYQYAKDIAQRMKNFEKARCDKNNTQTWFQLFPLE